MNAYQGGLNLSMIFTGCKDGTLHNELRLLLNHVIEIYFGIR